MATVVDKLVQTFIFKEKVIKKKCQEDLKLIKSVAMCGKFILTEGALMSTWNLL